MPDPKVSVLKRVDCQSTLSVKRESTVVGERENGRARETRECLLLTRPFLLVPTTSKRLLRRLRLRRRMYIHTYITFIKVSNRSGAFWH